MKHEWVEDACGNWVLRSTNPWVTDVAMAFRSGGPNQKAVWWGLVYDNQPYDPNPGSSIVFSGTYALEEIKSLLETTVALRQG